jgi:aminoglycoside phosphotransferase (APT) family kinase protein
MLQLDDAAEQRLAAWIEQTLSCEVLSMERQQRWRPCWYVDVRLKDGSKKPLYVRGERSIYVPESRKDWSLEAFHAEYEVMQVLEAEGAPIPHIHGLCPDPLAIVTDRAKGRSDLSTTDSDNERGAVLGEYMEVLARIHAINPAKFDGIAIPRPKTTAASDVALPLFQKFEKRYREAKRRPEPVIEFMVNWVKRNAPDDYIDVRFIVCDVAQFMFEDGKLTALLDLELAYMGDPVQDLAALQLRNTSEPLGDIARALRHYETITGKPIDGAALDYHTIAYGVVTPVSMTENISGPLPTNSVLQYFEWWILLAKLVMELIAATTGRDLPAPEPLTPEMTPFGPMAESLVGAISAIPVEEGFATYERDSSAKLARFMARVGELGGCAARRDIADAEALLGVRFGSTLEADRALEAFVLQAGAEEDDRLIPLLYKRLQRQWEIFTPFVSRESLLTVDLKTHAQLMAQ